MCSYCHDKKKKKGMSDDINDSQIIQCPFWKTPITVVELGEYVNANPETKKQAIKEELELWGDVYDRSYLMENVVFCPNCRKVIHFKDWDSDIISKEK